MATARRASEFRTVLDAVRACNRAAVYGPAPANYRGGPVRELLLPDPDGELRAFGKVLSRFVEGQDGPCQCRAQNTLGYPCVCGGQPGPAACDGIHWEAHGFAVTDTQIIPQFPIHVTMNRRAHWINERLEAIQSARRDGQCYEFLTAHERRQMPPYQPTPRVALVGGHPDIQIPWRLRWFLGTVASWTNLIFYTRTASGEYKICVSDVNPKLSYYLGKKECGGSKIVELETSHLDALFCQDRMDIPSPPGPGSSYETVHEEMEFEGFVTYHNMNDVDFDAGITLDPVICASYSFEVGEDKIDPENNLEWPFYGVTEVVDMLRRQMFTPAATIALLQFLENRGLLKDALDVFWEEWTHDAILQWLEPDLDGLPLGNMDAETTAYLVDDQDEQREEVGRVRVVIVEVDRGSDTQPN